MAFPKLKFITLDINENLDNLVWYLNKENSKNSPLDFYKFSLRLFPELEGKIKDHMSDEDIYMILLKEVKPILINLAKNKQDIKRYQDIWDKIGDSVFKDLENTLDIKWKNKEIFARVGMLPVAPRDVFSWTFDLNYDLSQDNLIATCIHELCHFLYFEKWKELYPDYKEEEFDNPHIVWYLSEAMIDPLINNATFKKYTASDLSCYSVFYEIYIDNKSIIEILREYVCNYPIDIAIKKGYELFKKYEDLIKK